MTTKWIDEQETTLELGSKGFLVNFSNAVRGSDSYSLRDTPAHTNQSHQPRLYGWCGTYNDTATYGCGVWEVVRIAKNGRTLIKELNEAERAGFLEEMGYPDLDETD